MAVRNCFISLQGLISAVGTLKKIKRKISLFYLAVNSDRKCNNGAGMLERNGFLAETSSTNGQKSNGNTGKCYPADRPIEMGKHATVLHSKYTTKETTVTERKTNNTN